MGRAEIQTAQMLYIKTRNLHQIYTEFKTFLYSNTISLNTIISISHWFIEA